MHHQFNPSISIIIPVYDVSHYLRKCVDSITNQTLDNIEIILVNDCSSDPLDDKICSEYESLDPRVKYITHKKNKGLGGARNTGVENATGEYIWFIDSDDFIDINACEFLYALAKKTESDIIAFSATSHIDGGLNLAGFSYYHYQRNISILDQLTSGPSFIQQAMTCDSFHVSACLHLFKRALISKYKFRENIIHEDTDLIPIVIYNAKSIFCTDYAPYYRLLREGSITQQAITNKALQDRIAATHSLLNYIDKHDLAPDDPLSRVTRLQHKSNLATCSSISDGKNHTLDTSLELNILLALNKQYGSILDFKDSLTVNYNIKQLRKSHSALQQELDRIKQSRLWKLHLGSQAIKRLFNL